MLTLFLSACAVPRPTVSPAWLPESPGWDVRQVDDSENPQWVVYERDALVADVKEFRLVGVVDAEPEAVVAAVRHRLLDEAYVPEGLQREILEASEDEIVIYGLMPLPFPFDDREATERIRFTHDPDTGVFHVDAQGVDPGVASAPGVMRIPAVHSTYRIAPTGSGRSVITNDSLHDIGGNFPNRLIYPAVCSQLIADLHTLQVLTTPDR